MLSTVNGLLLTAWTRLRDERGQDMAEYALLLAFIAVVAAAIAATALIPAIQGAFEAVASSFTGGGGS